MKPSVKSFDGRYAAAEYHLNMFLREHELPELDSLASDDVEGDRLQNLIENVGRWLAAKRLRTHHQKLWLGTKSKGDYFEMTREILEEKFPEHALFATEDWFADMKRIFKRECERRWIENADNDDNNKPADGAAQSAPPDPIVNNNNLPHESHCNATLIQMIAGFGTQLSHLCAKIDALEAKVGGVGRVSNNDEAFVLDLYRDNVRMTGERIEALREENESLKRQAAALQTRPSTNADNSEESQRRSMISATTVGTTTAKWPPGEQQQPATKKRRQTSPGPARADGEHRPESWTKVLPSGMSSRMKARMKARLRVSDGGLSLGGFTAADELRRLWDAKSCTKNARTLADGLLLPKKVLYDRSHRLFVGRNPMFEERCKMKVYADAMSLVAMAMNEGQWMDFLRGELSCRDGSGDGGVGALCNAIQERTMALALELEMETSLRKSTFAPRVKPTLVSLGKRFRLLCNEWKEQGKGEEEIKNMVENRIVKVEDGNQAVRQETEPRDEQPDDDGDIEVPDDFSSPVHDGESKPDLAV